MNLTTCRCGHTREFGRPEGAKVSAWWCRRCDGIPKLTREPVEAL